MKIKLTGLLFLGLLSLGFTSLEARASVVAGFTYKVKVGDSLKNSFEESFHKQVSNVLKTKMKDLFSNEMIDNLSIEVVVTNEFQRDIIAQDKNGKSLLFVSPLMLASNDLERLLAHEVFHLLHFQIKDEKSWLAEGIANFIPFYLYGKLNLAEINTAMSRSTVSLLDDFSLSENEIELYGATTLFVKYAFENCGGVNLLYNLIHSKEVGERAVTNALENTKSSKNICRDFSSLATSFTLARVVNKRNFSSSEELFLVDTSYALAVNSYLGEKLISFNKEDTLSFLKQIPRFLPIVLPISMKSWLVAHALKDKDLRVFEAGRAYPAFARELTVGLGAQLSRNSEFLILFRD